jgi:uncharacterized protein YqjF (DUF2071 family)
MGTSIFLKGEWRNLIMINYEIDPEILTGYLPPHTELDNFNGKHYVSLVGFLFKDSKVKGIIVPYHRTFEEITLRFYVRHIGPDGILKRGVVLIKEIATKKISAPVAGKIFGENQEACDTRHLWSNPTEDKVSVEYMWKRTADWDWISVTATGVSYFPKQKTEEQFITERNRVYSKGKKDTTTVYNVEHSNWRIHTVHYSDINCNFEKNFGKDFAYLNKAKPASVFLADGSAITMGNRQKLELETSR